MITVKEATTYRVREVVARSEFANVPGAEEKLKECLYRSRERYIAWVDDEVGCMWGLAPQTILSDQAYMWLITTDIAAEHKFLLVRYSQMFVERALLSYKIITGHVEAGNTSAKRWLRWLGAEFGTSDGKLMTFAIRRKE
jgi:hypothetical protein